MKIGILTQPLHINYGGLLQNYALQQILIREGHEVETIDWDIPNTLRKKLSRIKVFLLAVAMPQKYKTPYYFPTAEEQLVIWRNTNHFIQTYIRHTSAMTSLADFSVQGKKGKYDGYVVGSDQCWRPQYNCFLPAMFVSFAEGEKVKRIAYAASFGTDQWEFTPDLTTQCASLAQKFDLVTVREDSGVTLCNEHFGVDATHVLDPTMLLTKVDYIHLIEAEKEPQALGTLFYHILDPDAAKIAFVNCVADGLGLKPFQVLPKYQAEIRTKENVKKHIENCVYPRVTTWLRAFMDAEMTIVDSFHGLAFSILFNKPFWVIGNTNRGVSRFISLLRLFNLEDRLLDVGELNKVDFTRPIDWAHVNLLLEQKRTESINLLLNALK